MPAAGTGTKTAVRTGTGKAIGRGTAIGTGAGTSRCTGSMLLTPQTAGQPVVLLGSTGLGTCQNVPAVTLVPLPLPLSASGDAPASVTPATAGRASRTVTAGRASGTVTAGMPGGSASSSACRSSGGGVRDSRAPLLASRDKRLIAAMTDRGLEYLARTKYEGMHVLTRKTFHMPCSKQFFSVCVHPIRQVDPWFEIAPANSSSSSNNSNCRGVKPAEAIFEALQFLRCPSLSTGGGSGGGTGGSSVSRASLGQSGTPHAWPHLLGVLHWLVEVLERTDGEKGRGGVEGGEDRGLRA